MKIKRLKIPGSVEVELQARGDERGYFMRTYDEAIFAEHGLPTRWVQMNESLSANVGTIRGLHFQRPPHTEAKLVRCIQGALLDVFVDLRQGSPTYGQWDSVELRADRHNAVLVPRGCAHGFCSLEPNSTVNYMVDNFYTPAAEEGVRWNDPALAIRWPLIGEPTISAKDAAWPLFKDVAPVAL
ncbi:dTDP-4-dehydrorhamnose 3,5-epimerase [Dongia sedimenti]|uniref:dTDP-4-dehydrorhamnose 3,5-epimerase n=1 Tax=Dongia sedimenti TaxID=3064282 RepID=A0ABU0YHH8_9PROT|nr:dTDP-4-dehydrorhamnose 3,5-epimerase [Rhodospirillaceae bacterium R-7]